MKKEILVPEIEDSEDNVEEVEISQWLVEVGSEVKKGEILVELLVDKAAFELESEYDGLIIEIKRDEGEIVEVGEVLAVIQVEE